MELFILLLVIAVLLTSTAHSIRLDGWGRTPAIRSHAGWTGGVLPSSSYLRAQDWLWSWRSF